MHVHFDESACCKCGMIRFVNGENAIMTVPSHGPIGIYANNNLFTEYEPPAKQFTLFVYKQPQKPFCCYISWCEGLYTYENSIRVYTDEFILRDIAVVVYEYLNIRDEFTKLFPPPSIYV